LESAQHAVDSNPARIAYEKGAAIEERPKNTPVAY